jgi:hypothetical protein
VREREGPPLCSASLLC